MKECYVLVIEWKKILPNSPGMPSANEMIDLIVSDNVPQLIAPEFYNHELFLNYYASLLDLQQYSTGYGILKLKITDDYNFLVFNTLEQLEFYQEQKQNSAEWLAYVVYRDALIKLLGIESVTHSTRYSIIADDTNFDAALTELESNIRSNTT
jgi:hypothetical protein